ncbi:MAG TPA: condensation domain-containing protein, partial [Thermoanaerobaculia bacterium]|nr:condensation domain-containing protein [Thermoanaerobaculia bacterium]
MSKNLIEDIYPLSPLQQGILFHALLAPQADVYLRQVSYQIDSQLDVSAFERAWQATVDRHGVLRSCFVWEKRDEPQQVVFRKVKVPFERCNLRGLAPDERQRRVEDLLAAERGHPFKLSKAPLLRVTLAELSADRFRCVFTYHHLVLDGWSLARVLGEVAELYHGFSQQRPVDLPPSRPFADYVAWVRRQDMAATEAFFREHLRGFSTPTPVGSAPAAPLADAARFIELDARLGAAVTSALRTLLSRHGLTPGTLVQGAWALLLHRYSGERDVVFGTVFSGRTEELPDAESIVGLLINTLPLRARIDPAEPLLPWLARLQSERLALHRFEHAPLALIQQWSEVASGLPLFDSLLIFENFPRGLRAAGAAPVSDVRSIEATNYPLTLLAEFSAEIALRVACEAGRFPPAAAGRLLRHFEALLRGMAERPEGSLADLPLLTPEERQQALVEWNDTGSAMPAGATAFRLFEGQVQRQPQAVAMHCDGETLSYAELDRRADLLARRLRAHGVGPEVLVGIFAEVSPEMVVGLLAVWKAGGAYVPLDPDYPRERLALMLEDSGLDVLLTQERLLGRLTTRSTRVVLLDGAGEEPGGDGEDLGAEPAPENLAYVIYTSGSTGRPKGVQVSHAGLVNFLAAKRFVPHS